MQERDDIYRVIIPESSSPFTKKASTQFRPASVIMLEKEYCYDRESTKRKGIMRSRPSPYPIQPLATDICEYYAVPISVTIGDTFDLNILHTGGEPDSIENRVDRMFIDDNGDGTFTAVGEGFTAIEQVFVVGGKICYATIEVEIGCESSPIYTPPECELEIPPMDVTIEDMITIPIDDTARPIREVEISVDSNYLTQGESTYDFQAVKEGTTIVTVFVIYEDWRRCEVDVPITINPPPCVESADVTMNSTLLDVTAEPLVVGHPVTIVFKDENGNPFPFTSITCEGIEFSNINGSAGSVTFVPTTSMETGDYLFIINHQDGDCEYLINFTIQKFVGIACGVDLDTTGSAFSIFKVDDPGVGRYYLTYDMYEAADDLHVFDGDPNDPNSIVLHTELQIVNKNGSPLYFDYNDVNGGQLYIQINNENVTSGTSYVLKLYCGDNVDSEIVSTARPPIPGANPNIGNNS